MENQFFVDSEFLSLAALKKKHRLETDPSSRTNHMKYMPGMEQIHSDIQEKVMSQVSSYDSSGYTAKDVRTALQHETVTLEDFKALLSPAAEPFLEQMAQRARIETSKHFGNTVYLFTPLYIANYCENYCVYCGFNCYNHIQRMKLTMEQIEREMKVIADSGMEEILILTGESRVMSNVEYIGQACKLARKYFRMVGVEIYPVNTDEYRYLHECGVDYVTVFQETYDTDKYETLHLMGHKRIWPYRFDSQERALMGGMRGVGFSALLGLSDFRKDALASALQLYIICSGSTPKLKCLFLALVCCPIINNGEISLWMYMKSNSVRCCVRIVSSCRLWVLRFHPERVLPSVMALQKLPPPKYLRAFLRVLETMKVNTLANSLVSRKVTSSLKLTITAVCRPCMQICRRRAFSLC